MTATPTLTNVLRRRWRLSGIDVVVPAALVGMAFVSGYVLVRGGAGFGTRGPIVVLLVPLLPVLAVAIVNDLRLGVLAIVATFPIGVVKVPILPIQLVELAVLVVAVLVVLRRTASSGPPLPLTRPMIPAIAFCAWLLVSLPSSVDQHLSTRELVLFAVGVVTASVVVAACRTFADIRFVLVALLAVMAASAATVPLHGGALHAAYGGALVTGRATGIFVDPNQLGTFAATGGLVGLGLAFGATTARSRWLFAAAAATCIVALLLSLSRGAWIGFTVGAIVLLAKLPTARRALLVGGIPTLFFAVAVGSFAPSTPQVEIVGARLKSITGEKNPYDNRPALWGEAIHEISLDPVTGQGPGSFPVASTRATSKSRTVFGDHAHNLLLTWGAEDGVPAALLAIILAVTVHVRLRRVARAVSRHDRAVVAGLAAALAAVAGQGLVDYTLRNSVLLTTLFMLLGCAFAMDRIHHVRGGA